MAQKTVYVVHMHYHEDDYKGVESMSAVKYVFSTEEKACKTALILSAESAKDFSSEKEDQKELDDLIDSLVKNKDWVQKYEKSIEFIFEKFPEATYTMLPYHRIYRMSKLEIDEIPEGKDDDEDQSEREIKWLKKHMPDLEKNHPAKKRKTEEEGGENEEESGESDN